MPGSAFVRLLSRVPWQCSAALGWGVLIVTPTAAEVAERESAATAAAHERHPPLVLGAKRLAVLKKQGWLVVDGAVPPDVLHRARSECTQLREAGAFAPTDQHDASVRSDAVTWIEETESGGGHVFRDSATDPVHPGLLAVLRRLRAQAYELDASGFCGFSDAHHGPSSRRPEGVDLGVQRAGQLACYRAPSRVCGSSSSGSSGGAGSSVSSSSGGATGGDSHDNGSLGITRSVQAAREAHDAAEVDEVVDATRGARYTAHRDGISFGSGSPFRAMLMPSVCMRECTCILYLTEPNDWGEGGESPRVCTSAAECRGGSLVLYLDADDSDTSGATATSVVEILPIGGRLVIFDSRSVLHEVMPHEHQGVERLAMTVWIGGAHTARGFARHCQAWWLPRCLANAIEGE